MDAKRWYESRTVWVNGLVLALTLLIYVLNGVTNGELSLPVSPELVAMGLGIANLLLRFATSQPVK